MGNLKEKISLNKFYVILGTIIIIITIGIIAYSIFSKTEQILVQNGTIEKTEIVTGFLVKKENTIDIDQNKVLVPVVSENSRIAKGSVIATYKGKEYLDYEENLKEMDKEILEKMKQLPAVYSSEVDSLEKIIYSLVKESVGQTSYAKIEEYKQKINSYINKRATIIGNLSPNGAQVKKLIQKRNDYEQTAKKSKDNIWAKMSGVVIYSTDGLENELKINQALQYTFNDIKQLTNDNLKVNNTSIKVVNNYEAYIVVKASNENIKLMKQGLKYKLRILDNNIEVEAILVKLEETADGVDVYFKINNSIENIAGLREIEVEVVWNSYSGLIIPSKCLNKYNENEIYYITTIRNIQKVDVPVYVKEKNSSYAIVRNYTDEELIDLKLDVEYSLKLYDRIIIN